MTYYTSSTATIDSYGMINSYGPTYIIEQPVIGEIRPSDTTDEYYSGANTYIITIGDVPTEELDVVSTTIQNRLLEFYQWLKEEARSIELEDPGVTKCVKETIDEMRKVFSETIHDDQVPLWDEYVPDYNDVLSPRYHITFSRNNLITYGGSAVERFREHG